MAEKFDYTKSWLNEEDFPLLGFSRNWENPADYPTIEPDEAQVRRDMQSLHDEVKDYLNETLIPRVIAEDATVAAWQAQEDAHAEAEASRVLAEETRAANEQNRETAEAEREQIIAKVENLTVSSEGLDYGEPASAEVTTNPETGGLNVHFGLPMGKNGLDFLPVIEGDRPPTGVEAWIDPDIDSAEGGSGSGSGSGVVISPNEPTDEGADVWIDTDDEEGEFYNKAEVDAKFAEIPLGLTMKLLWENPNPDSDFATQTVALDLADYTQVLIFFYGVVGFGCTQLFEKGYSGKMLTPDPNPVTRDVSPSNTGVSISDCYLCATPAQKHNNYLTPRKIYGIKGVQ